MEGFTAESGVVVMAAPTGPTSSTPLSCVPAASTVASPSIRPTSRDGRSSWPSTPAVGPWATTSTWRPSPARPQGSRCADLTNVVNEAALLATRRSASVIEAADFGEAVERVVAGPQPPQPHTLPGRQAPGGFPRGRPCCRRCLPAGVEPCGQGRPGRQGPRPGLDDRRWYSGDEFDSLGP